MRNKWCTIKWKKITLKSNFLNNKPLSQVVAFTLAYDASLALKHPFILFELISNRIAKLVNPVDEDVKLCQPCR